MKTRWKEIAGYDGTGQNLVRRVQIEKLKPRIVWVWNWKWQQLLLIHIQETNNTVTGQHVLVFITTCLLMNKWSRLDQLGIVWTETHMTDCNDINWVNRVFSTQLVGTYQYSIASKLIFSNRRYDSNAE